MARQNDKDSTNKYSNIHPKIIELVKLLARQAAQEDYDNYLKAQQEQSACENKKD